MLKVFFRLNGRNKANHLLVVSGPVANMPSVAYSFYGILARIYMSFGENHRKLQMARLTSSTGD